MFRVYVLESRVLGVQLKIQGVGRAGREIDQPAPRGQRASDGRKGGAALLAGALGRHRTVDGPEIKYVGFGVKG